MAEKNFRVWSDNESEMDVYEDFDNLDDAYDFAVDFVHQYDGQPFRVICHIEDLKADETIDTFENV